MEFFSFLRIVRDPAVLVVLAALILYMTTIYATKDMVKALGKEISDLKDEYVSKEKLSDVMKPFEVQLGTIEREIKETKKVVLDMFKTGRK